MIHGIPWPDEGRCQTACKPGSVRGRSRCTAIPLGRASRRASRDQPGRRGGNAPASDTERVRAAAGCPYSVLLPVGFTLPPPLPAARCALTAPFHPCPRAIARAWAVCFLWHFPWGRPRRPLAGTVFPWSPDFPPTRRKRGIGGRPAVWQALLRLTAGRRQRPRPRTTRRRRATAQSFRYRPGR